MLSIYLIDRLFHRNRWDQLLDGLTANGFELPLPVRVRLGQSPTAVVALGLRRVRDLSYGPTPLSREMTDRVVHSMTAEGGEPVDALTAAAVAAALGQGDDNRSEPQHAEADARHRAIAALAAAQGDDGLFAHSDDRSVHDRALTSALVLCLLAGDDAFRGAVRFADLLNWFDEHADRLDTDTRTLWRLAMLDVPASAQPARLVAA